MRFTTLQVNLGTDFSPPAFRHQCTVHTQGQASIIKHWLLAWHTILFSSFLMILHNGTITIPLHRCFMLLPDHWLLWATISIDGCTLLLIPVHWLLLATISIDGCTFLPFLLLSDHGLADLPDDPLLALGVAEGLLGPLLPGSQAALVLVLPGDRDHHSWFKHLTPEEVQ